MMMIKYHTFMNITEQHVNKTTTPTTRMTSNGRKIDFSSGKKHFTNCRIMSYLSLEKS